MYNVLPNKRMQLITVIEVINMSAIMDDAPVKVIQSAIQIAEARIKSEICSNFYYDFRVKKNIEVTEVNKDYLESLFSTPITLSIGDIVNAIEFVDNEWYVEFWNEHLWKLLSEMTVYVASPTNYSRFTSQGEMENNPKTITNEGQNSASVDLGTMKWKLDRMYMDRISPLIASMNEYLFGNRGAFVKVDCKNWDYNVSPDGVATRRKTAWIFGIYDNLGQNGCYNKKDEIWGTNMP